MGQGLRVIIGNLLEWLWPGPKTSLMDDILTVIGIGLLAFCAVAILAIGLILHEKYFSKSATRKPEKKQDC